MLRPFSDALKLILFWIVCFDIHRILFSIHHFGKLKESGLGEWLLTFVYSFRLDLATAAGLSTIPFLFRLFQYYSDWRGWGRLFRISLIISVLFLVLVQAGEIVAYGEWNHKLTSRVFMHLSHPDEVARTANYSMIFWYILYALIQLAIYIFLSRKFFKKRPIEKANIRHWFEWLALPITYVIAVFFFFMSLRGGFQPVPLNINAASYSNKAVVNDISINSLYFFGKSYLLYNRSEIDAFIPKVDKVLARQEVEKWYSYPKKHDNYFLENNRPNVVFIVLEGWSAEAIGSLGPNKGATPNFDKLTKSGVLFTNIYATGTTSEIGNSSIFSGHYTLPEVSISMQPEKHRRLHCLNEDMEAWGYHSSYIFSGDLKYGNIGGYFMDHGFDVVKDESDFPSDLPRGKLNFFDRDLYKFLIQEINQNKKPFLQCAFTGSTHAPYDQPAASGKGKHFTGEEADFMNSLVYADECLGEFIRNCKKQPWYKNTLFVFVADHGHASPGMVDPGRGKFYHVPLLFYGEPIKKSYRGKRMDVIGSQADIAATLIYQMKGQPARYPYSKDLMNPKVPQFAFHAIIRGYGWGTDKGNFTYYMEQKIVGDDTFKDRKDFKQAQKNCSYFLNTLYEDYKKL
ncbi:LTA synthase family protein [uncultured Fluviicola sp.]|uniref:LTA synthase family protein n=1 Tax=uncultured Fluviicola sp. TaxID=463303 RepID=UPI0025F1B4D3|nr:LTA synthase family protein [uncultured Fluviicola sp.]